MSHRQYGFLIGLLVAWVWASTSFLAAVGAVLAGLIGYVVIRVLEGDIELGELANRFAANSKR